MPSNESPRESRIIRDAASALVARLPKGWAADIRIDPRIATTKLRPDAIVKLQSPSGQQVLLVVEAKRRIEPRTVPTIVEQVQQYCFALDDTAVAVVSAAYLSPSVRALLVDLGIGYIDTTGNIHLEVSSPGLFISTTGAERDPWPVRYPLASLRGRGAGAALRAIVDNHAPFGVRQLAEISEVPAPTLSRVITFLDREDILQREPRGTVLAVKWQSAIRRWAEDYGQLTSNKPTLLLDPRGISSLERRLIESPLQYAATGAFAAQRFNPIAPARSASLYVEDPYETAEALGLREVDSGANVTLLEPFDPVAFRGATVRDGLRCVAASQLAVDLLTGPGREPVQGEELLTWMENNESAWQA